MLRGLFLHSPVRTSRAITTTIRSHSNCLPALYSQHRLFSLSTPILEKALPPRLKINDADLTTYYLKGSGPGGQKINKTNSAVQLIHNPTGVVVKSQATRSRSQNEKIAKRILADRIEELQEGDQSRTAIKADRTRKKKASKMKKSRRKYRDLEGKKSQEEGDEEREEEGEEQGEGEGHGQDEGQERPDEEKAKPLPRHPSRPRVGD